MKNLIILSIMVVLIAGSFNASAKVRPKDVVGEWKYEVPTAPPGFEKGTFTFTEKEGNLAGKLVLMDGSNVDLEGVKLENDALTFSLYVEGGYVMVNTKIDGELISGVINSPQGDMKVTAQKVKKE